LKDNTSSSSSSSKKWSHTKSSHNQIKAQVRRLRNNMCDFKTFGFCIFKCSNFTVHVTLNLSSICSLHVYKSMCKFFCSYYTEFVFCLQFAMWYDIFN
jgi:hypothetical protein